MTRKERLLTQAHKERSVSEELAFQRGAEWADNNPKDDEEAEFLKDLEPPTEEEIMRQRREDKTDSTLWYNEEQSTIGALNFHIEEYGVFSQYAYEGWARVRSAEESKIEDFIKYAEYRFRSSVPTREELRRAWLDFEKGE